MKIGLIVILLSLALTNVKQSSADGWRGLVPLKSSCEDVKRILDVKKCEFSYQYLRVSGIKNRCSFLYLCVLREMAG